MSCLGPPLNPQALPPTPLASLKRAPREHRGSILTPHLLLDITQQNSQRQEHLGGTLGGIKVWSIHHFIAFFYRSLVVSGSGLQPSSSWSIDSLLHLLPARPWLQADSRSSHTLNTLNTSLMENLSGPSLFLKKREYVMMLFIAPGNDL